MPKQQVIKKAGQQVVKNAPAESRQSQQQQALAFKAEKQKQGKFGAITTSAPGAAKRTFAPPEQGVVRQSQDTAPNPNLPGGRTFQEFAAQVQQEARANKNVPPKLAPKTDPSLLNEVLPNQSLLNQTIQNQSLLNQGQNQFDVNTLGGAIRQDIADITADPLGAVKDLFAPENVALAVGAGPAAETIGAGLGVLSSKLGLGLTGLKIGKSAQISAEELQAMAAKELGTFKDPVKIAASQFTWDTALQKFVLKPGAKILAPSKYTAFMSKLSKFGEKTINLNTKNIAIIGTLYGFGKGAVALYQKYVQEGAVDLSDSINNDFTAEANRLVTEQDYSEAIKMELYKQQALTDAQAIKDEFKGLKGIVPTILGKIETKLGDLKYDPVNGTEILKSNSRIETFKRMSRAETPKKFQETLDDDKANDLLILDAKTKSLIEQIQSQKVTAEGSDLDELTRQENLASANGASQKEIIIKEYDRIKKDFISLSLEQQDLFIQKYKSKSKKDEFD